MSWSGATSITFTGGTWITSSTGYDYGLDTANSTGSSKYFELRYNGQWVSSGANGPRKGIEFREINGDTYIYADSDNNDLTPYSFSGSSVITDILVKSSTVDLTNTTINLYDGPNLQGSFVLTSSMVFGSSGNLTFGQVGHVLTNIGINTSQTSSNWECVSVANNQYLYRRDGGAQTGYDFKYDKTNDQWLDAGTDWPSKFGYNQVNQTAITPTLANKWLYLYDGNNFVCALENNGSVDWTFMGTPRDVRVIFTAPTTAYYRIIDTANNNRIYESPQGQINAGTQTTHTFKMYSDVPLNPVFQLYDNTNGVNVANSITPPSSYQGPSLTSSWGTLDTSVTGGKVTLTLSSLMNIYYESTYFGDEIEVSDSNGTQLWTGQFGVQMIHNQHPHTIDISPVFQPTEVNTTKTLKLRIRNFQHGQHTYHDFVDNPTGHTSGSYTSPYVATYSISNPVWAQQVGNLISVSWTETNPPPATGVELWKTNGTSAISSSTTGGPLSYTLQSTSDNGTYELRYNGNVVQNSTSNSYNYVAPPPGGSATISNLQTSNYGATWSFDLTLQNNTVNNLYLRGLWNGVNSIFNPTTFNGNGTWQITNTSHSANNITLSNGDTIQAGLGVAGAANTYNSNIITVSGIPVQPTYGITGSWNFSNNTVTYTYTQSNGSSEQVEMFKPDGSSADGPNSYSGNQQTLTWIMTDATTDGTYTVTPGGGLATETSPQAYTYVPPSGSGGSGGGGGTTTPTQQTSVSLAPAKGGRKRRFPIISTQLFNRQRSVYSIGTTHHEIAPQF